MRTVNKVVLVVIILTVLARALVSIMMMPLPKF